MHGTNRATVCTSMPTRRWPFIPCSLFRRKIPNRGAWRQTDPGVALYCRRVLIDAHPLNPRPTGSASSGVIDSDDLPLNISRETMQDSALIQKLGDVITKRFLKFLDSESKDSAEKYSEFYAQFSRFIKEGVITDQKHREALAKLLRFESSMTDDGKVTGLEEICHPHEGRADGYLLSPGLCASIESGPIWKPSKPAASKWSISPSRWMKMPRSSLTEFSGKKLVSADSSDS